MSAPRREAQTPTPLPAPPETRAGAPRASRTGGRLLWFVLLYALSFVTFTALVYLLRFIVKG